MHLSGELVIKQGETEMDETQYLVKACINEPNVLERVYMTRRFEYAADFISKIYDCKGKPGNGIVEEVDQEGNIISKWVYQNGELVN